MKKLNLIVLIFFFAALTTLLFSCSKGDNAAIYDSILSQWTQEDGEQMSPTSEKSNRMIEKYIIVLAPECSGEISESAAVLGEAIAELTGAEAELVYSYEKYSLNKSTREIIIGVSSKSESELQKYKLLDYGYFSKDGTIYIGGRTDETTLSAIAKFKEDVVDSSKLEKIADEELNYFCGTEYDIDRVMLNGFELCDYTIVYPRGDASAESAANDLYRAILEKTGYCLPVKTDKAAEKEARAISIGATSLFQEISPCDENEFKISPYSTGVALLYSNEYGKRMALDRFLLLLLSKDDNRNAIFDINSEISQKFICEELSINCFYTSEPALRRGAIVDIYSTINSKSTDIVKIDGISKTSAEYILANLGDAYGSIQLGTDDIGTYHFYKKSRLAVNAEDIDTAEGLGFFRIVYTSLESNIEFCFAELQRGEESVAAVCDDVIDSVEYGRWFINLPYTSGESDDFDFNGTAEIINSADGEDANSYLCALGNDGYMKHISDVVSKSFGDSFEIILEIYENE